MIGRKLHWEFVSMIQSKQAKGETYLLQVVIAPDFTAMAASVSVLRRNKSDYYKRSDDAGNNQHLDQRQRFIAAVCR